jgi:hypothetical protein
MNGGVRNPKKELEYSVLIRMTPTPTMGSGADGGDSLDSTTGRYCWSKPDKHGI